MDVQTYHTPPSVVQQRHSQASSINYITKGDISTAENALCCNEGADKSLGLAFFMRPALSKCVILLYQHAFPLYLFAW